MPENAWVDTRSAQESSQSARQDYRTVTEDSKSVMEDSRSARETWRVPQSIIEVPWRSTPRVSGRTLGVPGSAHEDSRNALVNAGSARLDFRTVPEGSRSTWNCPGGLLECLE